MYRFVRRAAVTVSKKKRTRKCQDMTCRSSLSTSTSSSSSKWNPLMGESSSGFLQDSSWNPTSLAARHMSTSANSSNTSTGSSSSPPRQQQQQQQQRFQSSAALLDSNYGDSLSDPEDLSSNHKTKKQQQHQWHRLERLRNIGILAHVDAGKTTVTERMLALAGVVAPNQVGRVDTGNTVTDYLPQERERGITIQSAAIQFDWGWHHAHYHITSEMDLAVDQNDRVHIQLIDTPGHVDFSQEVHRSVAVLDGAVLVVDAVAGVQAQTETVWKCMQDHSPHGNALPSLVVINKMDKEGCHFGQAMQSIRDKLPGAHPLPIQLPLFRLDSSQKQSHAANCLDLPNIVVGEIDQPQPPLGDFCGVLDLIHMRAIVYPETTALSSKSVEECVPDVYPLLLGGGSSTSASLLEDNVEDALIDATCPLTLAALRARHLVVEQLAGECDDALMEEYYLDDAMPSPRDLQQAIRTAALSHKALPVLAAAALRGKGIEPLLDAVADLLPSPLDRPAPALLQNGQSCDTHDNNNALVPSAPASATSQNAISLGHPLHNGLLAFAFKVCHLSGGKGGSGDGRVVFCRVYSGQLSERDVLHALSPPTKGETETIGEPRKERVGGMLELKGGLFTKKENGICQAGDVCALVGLKSVVTGDTLVLANKKVSKKQQKKSGDNKNNNICLAGVSSPKPVLQVRLEAETQRDQVRLSECLQILSVEDPSLRVEESDSATLLSGLGELHIEITLDRLQREFGLTVHKGTPRVAYRETIADVMDTGGLVRYDKTVGEKRLQGAVHLRLEPCAEDDDASSTRIPQEPSVTVGAAVLEFLQQKPDATHEECLAKCAVYKALVQGCQGALRRGLLGSYAMANMTCHVEAIDAEDGLAGLQELPGAMRAAAMNAVSTALNNHQQAARVLEPSMNIEINLPNDMVGTVLSDLTGRRGTVGDVITGDEQGASARHQKTIIRGEVPLVEILGYANSLRSLTGGEATFTAEYKGHSVCSQDQMLK